MRGRKRGAHSACSQARSSGAIRCSVPRTVHVRTRPASRTAARVSPGTRERSASPAERTSWAWTPHTARAASAAEDAAAEGHNR